MTIRLLWTIIAALAISAPQIALAAEHRISVVSATYGIKDRQCDAMKPVAAACNGKPFCGVDVRNHTLCGDPAHGSRKVLSVTYTCSGDGPYVQENLEFTVLRLGCPRDLTNCSWQEFRRPSAVLGGPKVVKRWHCVKDLD